MRHPWFVWLLHHWFRLTTSLYVETVRVYGFMREGTLSQRAAWFGLVQPAARLNRQAVRSLMYHGSQPRRLSILNADTPTRAEINEQFGGPR